MMETLRGAIYRYPNGAWLPHFYDGSIVPKMIGKKDLLFMFGALMEQGWPQADLSQEIQWGEDKTLLMHFEPEGWMVFLTLVSEGNGVLSMEEAEARASGARMVNSE